MDASQILCSTISSNALSSEMSLTPTLQTPPPTTPRTTTHTPREIPTMYILDQMYDDYMDQYNSNNITTPTENPDTNASVQLAPCPICARTFNPVTLRKHVGICEKMATKKRNVFDSFRQRREGTELASYPLPKNFGLPEKTASSTCIAQSRSERGHSPKPAAVTQQVSSPIMTRKKPAEDLIRSTARASMRKVAASTTNAAPTALSTNFNRDRLRSSERSLTRRGIQPLPAAQCPHCERCFGINTLTTEAIRLGVATNQMGRIYASCGRQRVKAYDRHVEWCKEKALQAAITQGNTKTDGNVAKARLEARTKYRAPCLKTKRSINRDKYSGLTGEENEPDDSPKISKSSNKTQENSLMSMSMTSSMTSERKITNPTGNINEPSSKANTKTPAAAATTANRKCSTRDKSQSSQPPPTTKTQSAALAEEVINFKMEMPDFRFMGEQMAAAAAINKKRKSKTTTTTNSSSYSTALKSKQQQIISRKCDQKLETTDANINLPPIAPTLTQHKIPSDLSLKSMHTIRFKDSYNANDDHKHEEMVTPARNVDLTDTLMNYDSPKKLRKQTKIKTKTMAKSFKMDNKISYENPATIKNHIIDETPDAKKSFSAHLKENAFLNSKNIAHIKDECLPYYEHDLQECRILGSKKLMVLRKDGKRQQQSSEMSSEATDGDQEDFSKFSDNMLLNNLNTDLEQSTARLEHYVNCHESMIMEKSYSKDFEHNEKDYKNNKKYNENVSTLASSPEISISNNDLRSKTTKRFHKNQTNHEAEVLAPPYIITEKQQLRKSTFIEEIVEIHKFTDLSKSQSKEQCIDHSHIKKERGKEHKEFSANEALTPKHKMSTRPQTPKKQIVDNDTLQHSESKDKLSETDIYKDCLTDSDELRVNKNSKTGLVGYGKPLSGCLEAYSKSESVSNDLYAPREANDHYQLSSICSTAKAGGTFTLEIDSNEIRYQAVEKYHEKSMKSHFNFNEFPYNKKIEIPLDDNEEDSQCDTQPVSSKTNERNDTPRTSKAIKLPRASTPPPSRFTSLSNQPLTQSLPTTPSSTPNSRSRYIHAELKPMPLKSLTICRPKRKKVLRPTASCTTSSMLPMKAMPLFRKDIEISDVSSAPHITNFHNISEQCTNNDDEEKDVINGKEEGGMKNTCIMDKEIKVIKEPPQLKRNKSFTISGLPDNYDPFLSAKRQLEDLCSTTSDSINIPTTPQTSQLPSLPVTPNTNKMSTSLILSSSTPNTIPSPMTTSQIPPDTPKTPIMVRSSSFRRTASLRGPRRSPLLSTRPPLFAQKQRPTIQRGLSDEGPISTNFLKPEEYDEIPVRSVCVNDFAITHSPRVVRRDTSALNRKQQQPLKLNINAANANTSTSATVSPNITEPATAPSANTVSKYVSKTDSLAVFLKYEHELEKINNTTTLEDIKEPATASSSSSTPLTNLDGPLNAKELKDKSNNLSKQNSAKNIKADVLELGTETPENYDHSLNTTAANTTQTNEGESLKYGQIRLAPLTTKPSTPLTKPSTPLTKPSTPLTKPTTPTTIITKPFTPQLTPLNINPIEHTKNPKSPKPVALSSLFGGERNTKQTTHSSLLYAERKSSIGSDYIDPKLINKCDNLPINLKRSDFKHSDSDASEPRMEHFSSSSSSESSAPAKKPTSLTQNLKFLPVVKQQQQQEQQPNNSNNFNTIQNQSHPQHNNTPPASNSQRNSAEGRNLFKRRMRLGRNQFLYDASPEGDSCSADDEANRSSMECDNHNFTINDHEKAFERLSSAQHNPIDASFIPPLPAFDDFDFEEFLSSFENDEEQFPLFKDCREFLLNRTSKKQRSMVMPNSNPLYNNNNSAVFKKSSQQTFPPLTPQAQSTPIQHHFQFPTLPQHPKNLFNSFSHNTRTKNKYDDLTNTRSTDTFVLQPHSDDFKDVDNGQKREIFISIETEQNDLDKTSISPNTIRNMVGNPQTVVEVEVDAAHDNKFSKISDDDDEVDNQDVLKSSSMARSKNFPQHLEHLPNVQLNNAKNLIQQMQEDFRQMGEEMSANIRQSIDHRTTTQTDMNSNSSPMAGSHHVNKSKKSTGTPSGDAYPDSDELSSLDGYPLSSPTSRLGVSSKTSADSAYGSLSRQRSSELTSQRNSSRNRPLLTTTANALLTRPLTEESSLGRSRQLSASSSSSSEHALPPIAASNSYTKQHQQHHHQQQQQQQLYNNNNMASDLDDMMRYERNNNYDVQQPMYPSTSAGTANTNSHSNLESSSPLYSSNSTMSTSMKMSRFCHECGSKFLVEQAKFCMDCGIKRIVL